MHHERVDGVRVVWDDLPGPYHGVFVVGCGARDEDVDQLGLTTLVVKLVGEAQDVWADDTSVDSLASMVASFGSPDEATGFFTGCCAALADLPLDNMAEVARQIDPVDRLMNLFATGGGSRDPWASLLARRLGRSGPGLMRWPIVDSTEFAAEEVRSHVARYFTADNAVLALSGAPRNGLRLPLPAGSPAPRAGAPEFSRFGGCWYTDEVDGVGIAISGTVGSAAIALQLVLAQRVRAELRRLDLQYVPTRWWTPLDRDRVEFGLTLRLVDAYSEPVHWAAAQVLWLELHELAANPPDREEVEFEVENARVDAELDPDYPEDLPDQQANVLYRAGQRVLFGVSDVLTDEDYADASPEDVRSAAASWLATATVVVPAGTDVELDGMSSARCPVSTFVPDGVVLEPLSRSFWRRLRKAGAADRLVLADDAVHLVAADGAVHTFPMADIMVIDDGPLLMLGNIAHGCLVNISAFGGREMFAERLPARRYRTTGTSMWPGRR